MTSRRDALRISYSLSFRSKGDHCDWPNVSSEFEILVEGTAIYNNIHKGRAANSYSCPSQPMGHLKRIYIVNVFPLQYQKDVVSLIVRINCVDSIQQYRMQGLNG